jgi:hypothetical protein
MFVSSLFRTTRRLFVVGFLALFAAACDEPFSPYWDRGTYDLTYANNRRVPALVSQGPGGSYTEVTGGALTLRRDHSYQLIVDVRVVENGRVYDYSKVFAGEYENEDRTIYLTWFDAGSSYPRLIVANWRGGRIELVVPRVDGNDGVLCEFSE